MKTFRELKIGDQIYTSDNDYGIKSIYITGIIDVNLSHNEYDLYLLGRKKPVRVLGHMLKHTEHIECENINIEYIYYSCLEVANEERANERNNYISKQFAIAMQAFRKIKKASPNDESLKKRIYNFFQIGGDRL